jgi:hypothetical protein
VPRKIESGTQEGLHYANGERDESGFKASDASVITKYQEAMQLLKVVMNASYEFTNLIEYMYYCRERRDSVSEW